MIKWLPNSMGISPVHPKCIPYYEKMKELGMVLLVHTGEEKAVISHDELQKFGNPLLLRKPLDLGVKIIMAHCASLGQNRYIYIFIFFFILFFFFFIFIFIFILFIIFFFFFIIFYYFLLFFHFFIFLFFYFSKFFLFQGH